MTWGEVLQHLHKYTCFYFKWIFLRFMECKSRWIAEVIPSFSTSLAIAWNKLSSYLAILLIVKWVKFLPRSSLLTPKPSSMRFIWVYSNANNQNSFSLSVFTPFDFLGSLLRKAIMTQKNGLIHYSFSFTKQTPSSQGCQVLKMSSLLLWKAKYISFSWATKTKYHRVHEQSLLSTTASGLQAPFLKPQVKYVAKNNLLTPWNFF